MPLIASAMIAGNVSFHKGKGWFSVRIHSLSRKRDSEERRRRGYLGYLGLEKKGIKFVVTLLLLLLPPPARFENLEF